MTAFLSHLAELRCKLVTHGSQLLLLLLRQTEPADNVRILERVRARHLGGDFMQSGLLRRFKTSYFFHRAVTQL